MAYRPSPPPPFRANRMRTPRAGYGNAHHGVDAAQRYSDLLEDMFAKCNASATNAWGVFADAKRFGEPRYMDDGMEQGYKNPMEKMYMHGEGQGRGQRAEGYRRQNSVYGRNDVGRGAGPAMGNRDAHREQQQQPQHRRDGYPNAGAASDALKQKHQPDQREYQRDRGRQPEQDHHHRRNDGGHHPQPAQRENDKDRVRHNPQHHAPQAPHQTPKPAPSPHKPAPPQQHQQQNPGHSPSPPDLHALYTTAMRHRKQLEAWDARLQHLRRLLKENRDTFEKKFAEAKRCHERRTREGERRVRECFEEAERAYRACECRMRSVWLEDELGG